MIQNLTVTQVLLTSWFLDKKAVILSTEISVSNFFGGEVK